MKRARPTARRGEAAKPAPAKSAAAVLSKADPNSPAFAVTGRKTIAIKTGTVFRGRRFPRPAPLSVPAGAFVAGADYAVVVPPKGAPTIVLLAALPLADDVLGGFHVALGGNAKGNKGGDDRPAINPSSVWDIAFRPACPDPRGMTLVDIFLSDLISVVRGDPAVVARFWCDIYLTAADHLAGTSRCGVEIADGNSLPQKLDGGGRFDRFDYATAAAILKHHGKQLLGPVEFFAAALGVTERSAAGRDPVRTGLDAPRTSRAGLMQAVGTLWTWGDDGHPIDPRAAFFGGSWRDGDGAGLAVAAATARPRRGRLHDGRLFVQGAVRAAARGGNEAADAARSPATACPAGRGAAALHRHAHPALPLGRPADVH